MDELTRLAHAGRLGRGRALERFIAASYPDVRRLCGTLVDPESADDLAQETFLRVIKAIRRFQGRSSAQTWIIAIARRVCVDELRARARRTRRDRALLAAASTWSVPDPAGELAARDLLNVLDPNRRAAFILTQLFRLSYKEAAAICECPPGTIRSRVARAREDLVAALASPGHVAEPRQERRSFTE